MKVLSFILCFLLIFQTTVFATGKSVTLKKNQKAPNFKLDSTDSKVFELSKDYNKPYNIWFKLKMAEVDFWFFFLLENQSILHWEDLNNGENYKAKSRYLGKKGKED